MVSTDDNVNRDTHSVLNVEKMFYNVENVLTICDKEHYIIVHLDLIYLYTLLTEMANKPLVIYRMFDMGVSCDEYISLVGRRCLVISSS